MASLVDKPKETLSAEELHDLEQFEFTRGPLKVLSAAVQNNDTVLISLRNNHKLIAKVKAFDRHCNMVLEKVKDLWSETPKKTGTKTSKNQQQKQNKVPRERYISKMFLRGDSVVVILKHGQ